MFSVDTAHSDAQSGDGLLEVGGGGAGQVLFINIKLITGMFVANGNTF